MGAPIAAWLFAAAYYPALQVLPLYLWHARPRSETIYQRMAASGLVAVAAAWVPTARRLAADGNCSTSALLASLGLRTPGLAAAAALPLALTALLFAGPLAQLALGSAAERRRQPRGALPPAAKLRNWAAAPLLEEFVFRSCLLSFLLACGASPATAATLSPLLFGAAHLHHLSDLTRHQGVPLRAALHAVLFQLAYTTLFGWLAAFFFVRTRHLAAAALPHAFCNVLGPPRPPPPAWGRRRRVALVAAYAAGLAGFFCLAGPLTRPWIYGADEMS